MESRKQPRAAYEVPTYEAPADAGWFHFLHGNVPGHQIDFIYRHTVPRGPLSRQHFGHLVRILQYIEPRDPREQAFAIGNLSRDDTQHEPGHGGIALILSLRVHGARDHAGREDPSFSHAVVGVDREFDADAFATAALAFRRQLVESTRMTADGVGFYHAYTSCGEDPLRAGALLHSYVADFENLPTLRASRFSLQWTARGIVQPKRIVIVHADGLPFEELVHDAARIAAILYTSDVRWTMLSNGREEDLPNGTTIRFVPASVGACAEEGVVVHRLEDLPAEAEALAWHLFQAKPVGRFAGAKERRPWRDEATKGDDIEVTIDESPREEATKPMTRRSRRWFVMALPIVLVLGVVYGAWFAREQGAEPVAVVKNPPPTSKQGPPPVEHLKQDPAPMASGKPVETSEPTTPATPVSATTAGNTKKPNPGRKGKTPSPKNDKCKSDLDDCTRGQRQDSGGL